MENREAPAQPDMFGTNSGIDLRPHKTIRIAVSGDVHLTRLETQIVDTSEFQRLRYIRQLGPAYFVFPTAIHTRFDHSLGVLHMANLMIAAIRNNRHTPPEEKAISDEQEVIARLFALLHDVGHVPFGHTIEDEFHVFPRHDSDPARLDRFLGRASTIGRLIERTLGPDLYERFIRVVQCKESLVPTLGEDAFIYDLVANTACADLLDYLRRDFLFCNLALDTDYRFLNFLYIANENGTRRLVIRLWKPRTDGRQQARRDLLSELVRLLDNRYLLGERVYFHHAKLIAGAMIAGAVARAYAANQISLADLYSIGDEALLRRLAESSLPTVRRLGNALLDRRLWKEVWARGLESLEGMQAQDRSVNVWEELKNKFANAGDRSMAEDTYAGMLDMEPGDFLVYCPDLDMNIKAAKMKVFWNGRVQTLEDAAKESGSQAQEAIADKLDATRKAHKRLWSMRAFVNPEHVTKHSIIEQACDCLCAFSSVEREAAGHRFYESVVEATVASSGLAKGMPHEDYDARVYSTVDRILAHKASPLDQSVVRRIVTDAFKDAR